MELPAILPPTSNPVNIRTHAQTLRSDGSRSGRTAGEMGDGIQTALDQIFRALAQPLTYPNFPVPVDDGLISRYGVAIPTLRESTADFKGARIDVKMAGAMGDNLTNDTAAIQNGLDTLAAVGGGTLFFPGGTYLIQPTAAQLAVTAGGGKSGILQISANTHIHGDGMGISIVKIADYAGVYASIFGPIGGTAPYDDYTNILFSDITFDQNSLLNYPPYMGNFNNARGLIFSGQGSTNMHFERLHVDNVMCVNVLYLGAPLSTVRGCKFTNIGGKITGTANTSGTTVTRLTGPLFRTFRAGSPFRLDGIIARFASSPTVLFSVATVIDDDHLTLNDPEGRLTAATHSGIGWSSNVGFDHSTLYMTRNNQIVSDSFFEGRGFDMGGATTAIETHGGGQTITANSIDKMLIGMNVTGISAEGDSTAITITDNTITNTYYGIALWSWKYPDGTHHQTGYGMRDVICANNAIRITQTKWVYGSFGENVTNLGNPAGINGDFHSTLPFKGNKIDGNVIEFDLEDYFVHLDGSTATGSASGPHIVTITGYTVDGSEVGKTLWVKGGTGFNQGIYPIIFADTGANTIYLGGSANVTSSSGSGLVADIAYPNNNSGGGVIFWDAGPPVKVFPSGTATIDATGLTVTVTSYTPGPEDVGGTMGFVSGTNVTPGSAHLVTAVAGQVYTITPSAGGPSSDVFGFISLAPSFDFYEQHSITNNKIINCPMTGIRVTAAGTDLMIADNHIVNPGSTRLRVNAPSFRSGILADTTADLVHTTRDQVNTRVLRNSITDNQAVTRMDQGITFNTIGNVNAISKDNIITVNGDAVNFSQPHVVYTATNAPFIQDIVDAPQARQKLLYAGGVSHGSEIFDITQKKRWYANPTRGTWFSHTYRQRPPNVKVYTATNASPIVVEAEASFPTGTTVEMRNILGNTAANGVFVVTNVDKYHFSLDGSTGNGACTNTIYNVGFVSDHHATISDASNASPIVITANRSFPTGARVKIGAVVGNTAANSNSGQCWIVTNIDGTHFSLNGSTGNGAYVSGGGACDYDFSFPEIIWCADQLHVRNGLTPVVSLPPLAGWMCNGDAPGTAGEWEQITLINTLLDQQFQGAVIAGNGFILPNNKSLLGYLNDNVTLKQLIGIGGSNQSSITNPGGGVNFLSSTGTPTIFSFDDTGVKLLLNTASKPMLTDSSKYIVSGNIDVNNAAHIAATGFTDGQLAQWNASAARFVGAVVSAITQLTGDVTAGPGSGSVAATVAFVGGSTAANVHAAELLANAATANPTASKIVIRDSGGLVIAHGFSINLGSGQRWNWIASGSESGGNAGSDAAFNCYDDSAVFLSTPITIRRSDGRVTFNNAAGVFITTPTNTTKSVVTIDGTQTLTNKDHTATSNTFALPVIQRNDSISLTGQTITIGPTNLRVGGILAPAGLYRVSCYLVCTSAGSGGSASAVVGWNDGTAARTEAIAGVALSATNFNNGEFPIRADGANDITLTVTVTGATGSPIYSVWATLERLS